ncbi:MAG TPA: prolipoprotein diacylglyceryl transferase family protein [Steroidobacteraceae bacterium]|nr:prolipoprotein diacylglyceryl transferase family protein [Steroidobacteraceae bacterium]
MAFPYLTDIFHALDLNFTLPLPTFGLLVGTAFFTGRWLASVEARRLMPTVDPELMGNVCIVGFLSGLVGARIFHLLEYPREFLAHPIEMLTSRAGFTIFGGLIIGLAVAAWYGRRKGGSIPLMLDAAAPGLMLAYAIGRVGCQISGDGDWGIEVTSPAPSWLPDWLWAQTYDGNIAGATIPPPGVYPTPIYETLMSLAAFAILWRLRKRLHAPGWLFGVYLLLAGIERLLVEFIRVNSTYTLFGVQVTQAQLIATGCIVAGLVLIRQRRRPAEPAAAANAAATAPPPPAPTQRAE